MNTCERGWGRAGIVALAAALMAAGSARAAEGTGHPWDRPYAGEEAAGERVLALWQFEAGAELADSSGKGHGLKLRGDTRPAGEGRFGGGLECFTAPKDEAQGAQVTRHDTTLSPKGAFTLELWLKPKPEMEKEKTAFLLDCKYFHYAKDLPRANTGYVFLLRKEKGKWRPTALLGFGSASETFAAAPVALEAGTWYHLAFVYDGAGTGRVVLNGEDIGGATYEGRGDITPAKFALTIGGRYGSVHNGTPALFDQVRVTKGIAVRSIGVEVGTARGRTSFFRMEKAGDLEVSFVNNTGEALRGGTARISFGGAERTERIGSSHAAFMSRFHRFTVPVDTSLRPGRYELKVAVAVEAADGVTYRRERTASVAIVPRPLPHVMPVVMWGHGDLPTLKDIGFTHHIVYLSDYEEVWKAGRPLEAGDRGRPDHRAEMLNECLVQGIGAALTTTPGRQARKKTGYLRVKRAGKPYDHGDVCARHPTVREYCYNVGASAANLYGQFPAFQAALIHSEVRGDTNVCWHPVHGDAYARETGRPVPREVGSKSIGHYSGLAGFPRNRIVPDEDPILSYYRWFWEKGDGWNGLHTQVHKGLKSTGRDDLWTWYDPAVRVPSRWGSGGEVDVISQWTYCYPDPIKIGQAADELFAMAEGRPGQRVMKMTQVIWYRSQTAPELPADESKRAPWEKEIPDARFITIAPDHMREAFWSMIARPVRGIMYHGWASLVKARSKAYRFTNPETRVVLTELIREVVRPLGPTLLQVPDRTTDVALLESFASQIFANRGTWGWSAKWEADMHLILQWAQLQPRIVYEETVLRDGLGGFKVLVMPYCDVLPESVYRKVADFQRRGGILVADEHLTPALNPDILILSRKRTKKADEDKAALQAKAGELRKDLDTVYTRYGESDNADVVVRFRRFGGADYMFAINDKRTFGTYVGHHGRVMEKGLPNRARLLVRRSAGAVYDLVAHQPVPFECANGQLTFEASFAPCQGRLFLIVEDPIRELQLTAASRSRLGGRVKVRVDVLDSRGDPVRAVVPVQVEILDAQGRPAEFSGYYGATDGRLELELVIARNDEPGEWKIRARELASGISREHALAVDR